jgi:hypothetical protein
MALDSSRLTGARRVEDTWNPLSRALRKLATRAAKTLRISRHQVLRKAGVTLLGGRQLVSVTGDRLDRSGGADRCPNARADRGRLLGRLGAHLPVLNEVILRLPDSKAAAWLREMRAQGFEIRFDRLPHGRRRRRPVAAVHAPDTRAQRVMLRPRSSL